MLSLILPVFFLPSTCLCRDSMVDELEQKMNVLEKNVSRERDQIDSLQEELRQLRDERQRLSLQLDEKEIRLRELNDTLRKVQKEKELRSSGLSLSEREKVRTIMKKAKARIEQLEDENSRLSRELADQKIRLEELSSRRSEKCTELKKELSRLKKELKGREAGEKREVRQLNRKLAAALADLDRQEKIVESRAGLEARTKEIESLWQADRQALDGAQERINELENALTELHGIARELKRQSEEKDDELARLNSDFKKGSLALQENDRLRRELRDNRAAIDELNLAVQEKDRQIFELQRALERVEAYLQSLGDLSGLR